MKHDVQRIKEIYVQGMRVRLLNMNDIQAPPKGCEGTVRGVDDVVTNMILKYGPALLKELRLQTFVVRAVK